ncbi:hypothetical protein PW52_08225 [Tamlana sedimentorum]|uniref:Uncharacterized protein n=1 Tax=Neotamlana sedimentorum TaxID=1435349 RepID=A0A0D7W9D7_9FLAO|nr:hypothetical protein [Tamlana sedimentorum]KJD35719.1 hypothetical protein PW52_08225 [Tamlana sedimentorum]
MKTKNLHFLFFILLAFNFNCKQQVTAKLSEYKYTEQKATITCNPDTDALLKEAFYSFENDIIKAYDKTGKNKIKAYRTFINFSIGNRVQFDKILSKHTKEVFDALKTYPNLWVDNHLNYNSELVSCLASKIADNNLKTTFNALVSTNSMSTKVFTPAIRANSRYVNDPYLLTYIALDYFYAKMFQLDFTKINFETNTNSTEKAK